MIVGPEHKIYFLRRSDGLIKIGTTTDLNGRIASISKAHGPLYLLRTINGGRRRELDLHHAFRAFHQFGEWFRSESGALEEQIDALETGPVVFGHIDDARTEWERGEAEMLAMARQKVEDAIGSRCVTSRVKREKAIDLLTQEHGFSKWFLRHLLGNATTVSAYGFKRISDAYVAELSAHLAMLQRELATIRQEDAEDAALLAVGAELDEIASELEARKAAAK